MSDAAFSDLIKTLIRIHQRGSLHIMDNGDICVGCGGRWPCETRNAITNFAIKQLVEMDFGEE